MVVTPVPTVTRPALSLPTIAGPAPQDETDGVVPDVTMWPENVGSEIDGDVAKTAAPVPVSSLMAVRICAEVAVTVFEPRLIDFPDSVCVAVSRTIVPLPLNGVMVLFAVSP